MKRAKYFQLVKLFRNLRPKQIQLLILCCIDSIISLYFVYQVQELVDLIVAGSSRQVMLSFFLRVAVIGVVSLALGILQMYLWHVFRYTLMNQMSVMMYSTLLKKNAFFFDCKTTGDIASAIMRDGALIAESAGISVLMLILNLFSILAVLTVLFLENRLLGLLELVASLLFFLAISWINRTMRQRYKEMSQQVADVNQHVVEDTKAIFEIKTLNKMAYFIKRFQTRLWERYLPSAKRVVRINVAAYGANQFLSVLFPVLMILLGSVFAYRGTLTIGGAVLFYTYTLELVNPLNNLADFYRGGQTALGSADRVAEYLFTEAEEEKTQTISQEKSTLLDLDIQDYSWEEKPGVIRNLHRQFHSGDRVFLHGESGAGKTTLLKLICGFYPVTKGAVRINGTDVHEAVEEDLFRDIKIQFQEPVILEGTLRENVALGQSFTEEQVMEALEQACLGDFARANGIDYQLHEAGKNLSGGQKQRLALARIFIRSPRILILDEATSALDEENEKLIVDHVEKFVEKNHCILITTSHRQAFAQICNQELML